MSPESSTPPSTQGTSRKLSDVARHVIYPAERIKGTYWGEVVERAALMGVTFHDWQHGIGKIALSFEESGKYALNVGGIVLSIPRQVGKTFLVGMIVVALCTLRPNTKVLWTAHRTRTSSETHRKLSGMVQRPKIKGYLAKTRTNGITMGNGEEEIQFANGSIIMFGSRERGFGRGFDEVDVEVFDEAQKLSEKALEDMVPAANSSKNPRGPLLFFMGTPPRPVDVLAGTEFLNRRKKALAGASNKMCYVEFSADRGASFDDEAQRRKANPSYPEFVDADDFERMKEQLTDEASLAREAFGIWDEDNIASRRWSPELWDSRSIANGSSFDGLRCFGVAFSYDGSTVSMCGAIRHADGVHVELVSTFSGPLEYGVGQLADWLMERSGTTGMVSIAGSAGRALEQALVDRRAPKGMVKFLNSAEYFAANSLTDEAMHGAGVSHPVGGDGDVLDLSVAISDAKYRGSSGAWGWSTDMPSGDVTPVEAFCAAYFAARTCKRDPTRKQEVW